jgi:hypothetical protein
VVLRRRTNSGIERKLEMEIGDKVQHFNTGSVGTVLDSSYEIESPRRQFLVQWEDDLSYDRDSWERSVDLSPLPHASSTDIYFSAKE